VKCKTIDAYAIAEAEYVLEGYLDNDEKKSGKAHWLRKIRDKRVCNPFHPEWSGYMGKALPNLPVHGDSDHPPERPTHL